MGNVVRHGVRDDLPDLSMNNGLTSVFIEVLTIALSALAKYENEKRIAVWIACHDQEIRGPGFAGFRICDIPWNLRTFESDKQFMLDAIGAAANKLDWHKLDYSPREDWVLESLQAFKSLVVHFLAVHALPDSQWVWKWGDEPIKVEMCTKHSVYLNSAGCILCNGI